MSIIDLHCDTIHRIYHENDPSLYENSYSVDIKKLLKGKVEAQFFALFINKDWISENNLDIYGYTLDLYKAFHSEIKSNTDFIALAKNYYDLKENIKTGKISAFLTIEEGDFLENNIQRLDEFYDLGLRLLTLTWNYENCIGYPHSKNRNLMNKGLKAFGFEVIERMNELGVLIDVSHLSDGGFCDCIKHSKKPIIASHSNARSLVNSSRNLSDDMLRLLGDKGGIVGINFYHDFLGDSKVSRIEHIIKHIKHIKNIAGIDAIALGSDFDGISGELEIQDIGEMGRLVQSLEKSSFHPNEIEKICSLNAKRIIKECL